MAEHRTHADASEQQGRDRLVTIIEASLLAVVALLAAWAGYSSAKWSTESRLAIAQASTARLEAGRAADLDAETLGFDVSSFNTWFTAYVVNNQQAEDLAVRRFRPEFKVAFDAWIAADPFTSPSAPPGPTYMPEYQRPDREQATKLDAQAAAHFAEGARDADTADRYVRTTVLLASVLFLVGISGHFRVRGARYGLVSVGAAILIVAIVLLLVTPKPPV